MSDHSKTPIERLEDRLVDAIEEAVRASGLLDTERWMTTEPEIEVEGFAVRFVIGGDVAIRLANGDER